MTAVFRERYIDVMEPQRVTADGRQSMDAAPGRNGPGADDTDVMPVKRSCNAGQRLIGQRASRRWHSHRREGLVTSTKKEVSFIVAPDARLQEGTRKLEASDLTGAVGRHATVRYSMDGAVKTAHEVSVEAQQAARSGAKEGSRKL